MPTLLYQDQQGTVNLTTGLTSSQHLPPRRNNFANENSAPMIVSGKPRSPAPKPKSPARRLQERALQNIDVNTSGVSQLPPTAQSGKCVEVPSFPLRRPSNQTLISNRAMKDDGSINTNSRPHPDSRRTKSLGRQIAKTDDSSQRKGSSLIRRPTPAPALQQQHVIPIAYSDSTSSPSSGGNSPSSFAPARAHWRNLNQIGDVGSDLLTGSNKVCSDASVTGHLHAVDGERCTSATSLRESVETTSREKNQPTGEQRSGTNFDMSVRTWESHENDITSRRVSDVESTLSEKVRHYLESTCLQSFLESTCEEDKGYGQPKLLHSHVHSHTSDSLSIIEDSFVSQVETLSHRAGGSIQGCSSKSESSNSSGERVPSEEESEALSIKGSNTTSEQKLKCGLERDTESIVPSKVANISCGKTNLEAAEITLLHGTILGTNVMVEPLARTTDDRPRSLPRSFTEPNIRGDGDVAGSSFEVLLSPLKSPSALSSHNMAPRYAPEIPDAPMFTADLLTKADSIGSDQGLMEKSSSPAFRSGKLAEISGRTLSGSGVSPAFVAQLKGVQLYEHSCLRTLWQLGVRDCVGLSGLTEDELTSAGFTTVCPLARLN